MRGLRLSPVLEAELAFVVRELGALPSICDRCKAKLDSFADKCVADLSECCPGYLLIENSKAKFHREIEPDPQPEASKRADSASSLPDPLCDAKAERVIQSRILSCDAPVNLEIGERHVALRVWNTYTQSWWRTDLYQETPHAKG